MTSKFLTQFKLYRWWKGGIWVLYKQKWYQAWHRPGAYLDGFVDCDDGGGMFHYTYSGVEVREEYPHR